MTAGEAISLSAVIFLISYLIIFVEATAFNTEYKTG